MTGRAAEPSYEVSAWALLSRRLSPYVDAVLGVAAATVALTALLGSDLTGLDPRLLPPNGLAVVATLVAGLALAWRRTRPVPAFAVFMVACLVVTLTDHYIGLLSVLLLVSLYSLAAHGHRRRDGVIGLVLSLVAYVGLALIDVPDLRTVDVLLAGALLLTAWALGDAIRSRRAQQAGRLQVARQAAVTAREQAARAVTEERLRIARELHDVVAHSMSLIAVQAGVGGHVIRTDVAAAERALEVIAETSRDALTQTRSMLGLLRAEDDTLTAPPVQGIGDLDSLVEDVRRAGVDVSLTVGGTVRPLEAGVELTAYRVVQESLTNVLKHSGSPWARVGVTYRPGDVVVEVLDGGGQPAPAAPSGGHGLLGLRERVRLLGGELDCGTVAGAGFRVLAHLPAEPSVAA
jgi:signal transduction histidine kinase